MHGTTLPSGPTASKIEKLASDIDDPFERLRYLRTATSVPAAGRAAAAAPRKSLYGLLCLIAAIIPMRSDARFHPHRQRTVKAAARNVVQTEMPNIWLVEVAKDFEVYSNGLRIETRMAVANRPRSYRLESRTGGAEAGPQRSQPAGIVYHTTESDQLPFEADQTRGLKRVGQELLLFVRNKRAYHYLIDRFGRVHRVVEETDTANHAGNSIWADAEWVYIDLNRSFLGVSFETRTDAEGASINPAQVHAAKILTEMLRSRYNLPAGNCVTHAQVSVNPDNMRVGWHTDWGGNFPFREAGLPDNYQQPLPSLYLFGFDYDPVYIRATSPALWRGLALAEEQVNEAAAAKHLGVSQYRRQLRQKYEIRVAALHRADADKEN